MGSNITSEAAKKTTREAAIAAFAKRRES